MKILLAKTSKIVLTNVLQVFSWDNHLILSRDLVFYQNLSWIFINLEKFKKCIKKSRWKLSSKGVTEKWNLTGKGKQSKDVIKEVLSKIFITSVMKNCDRIFRQRCYKKVSSEIVIKCHQQVFLKLSVSLKTNSV